MYNGIGLATPRGSGTNGHVQRNWALVKPRVKETTYKTEEELKTLDSSANRQPNKEILDHERKRKIELKCAEFADILEEQGFTEEAIKNKVNNYRNMLLGQGNQSEKSVNQWGKPNVTETHQVAEAQQEKNARLREAFGISEYFVDGSSFDPDRQAKEKVAKSNAFQGREKQKAIEQELDLQSEKNETSAVSSGTRRYHLVHTPSPEPSSKPKKINDKNDIAEETSKKKKRKHRDSSSSDEEIIPKKKKKKKKSKSRKKIRHRSSSTKKKEKKKKRKHSRKLSSTSSNDNADSSSALSDANSSEESSSIDDEKKHKQNKKKKEKQKKKRRSTAVSRSSLSPKRKKSKNKKEEKHEVSSRKKDSYDEKTVKNKKRSPSISRRNSRRSRRDVSEEDQRKRDYSFLSQYHKEDDRNETKKNSRGESKSNLTKKRDRSNSPRSRRHSRHLSRSLDRNRRNRSRRRSRSIEDKADHQQRRSRRQTRSKSPSEQFRRHRSRSRNMSAKRRQHSRSRSPRSYSPRRRQQQQGHASRSSGKTNHYPRSISPNNNNRKPSSRTASPNSRKKDVLHKKSKDKSSSPQRTKQMDQNQYCKSTKSMSPKTPKLKHLKDSDNDDDQKDENSLKGRESKKYDNDTNRRRSGTPKMPNQSTKKIEESKNGQKIEQSAIRRNKDLSNEKQSIVALQIKSKPVVKLRHASTSDEEEEDFDLKQSNNDFNSGDKIRDQQDDKELHMLQLLKSGLAAKAKEALERKNKGLLLQQQQYHHQDVSPGTINNKNENNQPIKDTFDIAPILTEKVESSSSNKASGKQHLEIDHFDICSREEKRRSISKSPSRSRSRSTESSTSSKSSKSSKRRSRSKYRKSKSDRRSSRSRSVSSSSSTSLSSSDDNDGDNDSSSTTSRSRSPSIPRRHGSPSFLDRRRITSARKRPIPYHRHTPSSVSGSSSSSSSSTCSRLNRHSSLDSVCSNSSWQCRPNSRNCSTLSRSISRSPTKSVHSTTST